jgi:hypothetical protein
LPATIPPNIIPSSRSPILILIAAPSHPDCRATRGGRALGFLRDLHKRDLAGSKLVRGAHEGLKSLILPLDVMNIASGGWRHRIVGCQLRADTL